MKEKLNKLNLKILIVLCTLVFVFIIFYNIYSINALNIAVKKFDAKNSIKTMVILPNNSLYWNWFLDQFRKRCNKYKIIPDIEYYDSKQELLKILTIAQMLQIDSVIMCNIYNSADIQTKLKELKKKNIFIVSLFNDMLFRNEDVFVGVDYYYKGKIAGKILYEGIKNRFNKKDEINIAIVNNPLYTTIGGTLEIKGITDYLKAKGYTYINTKNFSTEYTSFPAEEIARQLVLENNKYNVIYSSNETETLSIVQMIVTFNKLDKFIIIGTGSDPKLSKYVKENILLGLINDNGDIIAQKLIESILNWKEYRHASSYISTNFTIIN